MKQRVADSIDRLGSTPRPRGVAKLKGYPNLYRVRVGTHRVVYEIDDDRKLVLVTRIRHRREAYS